MSVFAWLGWSPLESLTSLPLGGRGVAPGRFFRSVWFFRARVRPDAARRGVSGERAGGRETGPALEAHYRFLLWLVPAVERFPRSQKFLLGDRIQATALGARESLVEAAYARQRFAAPDMRAVFGYSQLAADAEPERDPGGDVGEEFLVGEMRIGKAQEARDRGAVADAPPMACSGCPSAGESWHGGG